MQTTVDYANALSEIQEQIQTLLEDYSLDRHNAGEDSNEPDDLQELLYTFINQLNAVKP